MEEKLTEEENSKSYLEYNQVDLSNYKWSSNEFYKFSDKVKKKILFFVNLISFVCIHQSGLKKSGKET